MTMIVLVILGCLYLPCHIYATCSFPSYMTTGTWFDSNYVEAEFQSASDLLLNQYAFDTSRSDATLQCFINEGNKYILKSTHIYSVLISGQTHYVYYYICMEPTKIADYSFYYYLQSVPDSTGDRKVAVVNSSTPTASDICTETSNPELFQVMIKNGFESQAVVQCPNPLLGNFMFTFEDNVNNEQSTGNLTVCDTRNTANISYETGSTNAIKLALSSGGYFGCLATVQSGSTYYTFLYNFDSTTNFLDILKFSCLNYFSWSGNIRNLLNKQAIEYDDTSVTASLRGRMCELNQNASAKPSDTSPIDPSTSSTPGGLIGLVPFSTCVPVTAEGDGNNTGVIVAVVVILLLLIAAIVGGILFYKFYYKPKKERERKLFEESKHPKSQIGMMKKALEAGIGGNIHSKGDDLDMVDMDDDDGIEATVTGINPEKHKSMKLNGKVNPVITERDDYLDPMNNNEIPREKTRLTSGFSADMNRNVDPRNSTDMNGNVPTMNGNVPTMNGNVPTMNGNVPTMNDNAPTTSNKVANGNVSIPTSNSEPPNVKTDQEPTPVESQKMVETGGHPFVTPVTVHDVSGIKREKSIGIGNQNFNEPNGKKASVKIVNVSSTDSNTQETSLNLQQLTKNEKKEDKLRKSVSFATDKQVDNSAIASSSGSSKAISSNVISSPKDKIKEEPVITLPREPSNLLGPRDTTLPEIDLKSSKSDPSNKALPDMTNF